MISRAALAAVLAAAACSGAAAVDTRVRIERPGLSAPVVDVAVDVATTAEERMRGLRGRDALADGEGLLIEMPAVLDDVCIVNDGVAFDIDAVYADGDGAVIAVATNIVAGDGTPRCEDGVRHVLEVSAGVAAGVEPGDQLVID